MNFYFTHSTDHPFLYFKFLQSVIITIYIYHFIKRIPIFETPTTKVASPNPYGLTGGILE
ncbi:hypothetical protein E0M27_04520 [Bacillus mycoides]|nr:hypothetical protein [Bacillus mycoides]TBX59059.1 hypothetical protein E0M27_04520 [Bacillus mycoides]